MKAPIENNVVQLKNDIDEQHLMNAQDSIDLAKIKKMEYCDEVAEFLHEQLFSAMQQFGIYVNHNKINENDCLLLSEALEGLMYRYYNIEHPIHDLADSISDDNDDGEEE